MHGYGQQFYHQVRAMYTGQFVHDRRHGRGTLESPAGILASRRMDLDSWVYRPVNEPADATNWEDDVMHGIAIFETKGMIHMNVVYKFGVCQMPLPSTGSPVAAPQRRQASRSVFSNLFRRGNSKPLQQEREAPMNVIQETELENVQIGRVANLVFHPAAEVEETAVLREQTGLDSYEEDVLITGGTKQNESLNGVYYKLSSTYGSDIYKSTIIRDAAVEKHSHKYFERFLFYDRTYQSWIIKPTPLGDEPWGPATAFVNDNALHPGDTVENWFSWDRRTRTMVQFEGEYRTAAGTVDDASKVDRVQAWSIVGYLLSVDVPCALKPMFLLRNAQEFYSRPVYESDVTGTFLYFMKDGGNVEDGVRILEHFSPGFCLRRAEHTCTMKGRWVISTKLGVEHTDPTCLAWNVDPNVTVNLIEGEWTARKDEDSDNWVQTAVDFQVKPGAKEVAELGARVDTALSSEDTAEGDDPRDSQRTSRNSRRSSRKCQPDTLDLWKKSSSEHAEDE